MSQYNPQAVMTPEMLERFRMSFESDPVNRLAQNAVTRVSVQTAALNHEAATCVDHTFSVMLP
ncbi:MAG: aminopeptidase, partial [Caldiserica bacterium]|nr:aminopeptidase [Caldisericota bacterium]